MDIFGVSLVCVVEMFLDGRRHRLSAVQPHQARVREGVSPSWRLQSVPGSEGQNTVRARPPHIKAEQERSWRCAAVRRCGCYAFVAIIIGILSRLHIPLSFELLISRKGCSLVLAVENYVFARSNSASDRRATAAASRGAAFIRPRRWISRTRQGPGTRPRTR